MGAAEAAAAIVVAILALLLVMLGVRLWRKMKSRHGPPPLSIVLLLNRPRRLTVDQLVAAVRNALGIDMTQDQGEGVFLEGEESLFLIGLGDHAFIVNNVGDPYVEETEAAARAMPEARLRKALREHKAWISVDYVGERRDADLAAVYGEIGKIAAELVEDDGLAIMAPAADAINVVDGATRDKLRGPDPLAAVREWENPPVISVPDDDPRMRAAAAEARRRWPEFVQAFRDPPPGAHDFNVKVPVTEGDTTEFVWLDVTGLHGDTIEGTLSVEPADFERTRFGDPVRARAQDVNDWVYVEGEEMRGHFTGRVIEEICAENPHMRVVSRSRETPEEDNDGQPTGSDAG